MRKVIIPWFIIISATVMENNLHAGMDESTRHEGEFYARLIG
jgi:hypothetical protein